MIWELALKAALGIKRIVLLSCLMHGLMTVGVA